MLPPAPNTFLFVESFTYAWYYPLWWRAWDTLGGGERQRDGTGTED